MVQNSRLSSRFQGLWARNLVGFGGESLAVTQKTENALQSCGKTNLQRSSYYPSEDPARNESKLLAGDLVGASGHCASTAARRKNSKGGNRKGQTPRQTRSSYRQPLTLSYCPRSTSLSQVTFVGDLTETDHDVAGKVYILDQDPLVIDEFSFDNNGFGVYINVATKGRNKKQWAKNRIDVPYPSGGSQRLRHCWASCDWISPFSYFRETFVRLSDSVRV